MLHCSMLSTLVPQVLTRYLWLTYRHETPPLAFPEWEAQLDTTKCFLSPRSFNRAFHPKRARDMYDDPVDTST